MGIGFSSAPLAFLAPVGQFYFWCLIFIVFKKQKDWDDPTRKSEFMRVIHFYGLSSTLLAFACAIGNQFESVWHREILRVFGAAFFLTALITLVIGIMFLIWSTNQFNFWQFTKGPKASNIETFFYRRIFWFNLAPTVGWILTYLTL